ncbi:Conserved_hypothetical protein [Hexamita inflata]|uniref:Uncharacterized protein n=1 Tax=Hexamita inflata TaxID=28002 RepID=A0AA86TSD7_9EUKA|nr:Conserved hypothetical protein [Hexamita inflata]
MLHYQIRCKYNKRVDIVLKYIELRNYEVGLNLRYHHQYSKNENSINIIADTFFDCFCKANNYQFKKLDAGTMKYLKLQIEFEKVKYSIQQFLLNKQKSQQYYKLSVEQFQSYLKNKELKTLEKHLFGEITEYLTSQLTTDIISNNNLVSHFICFIIQFPFSVFNLLQLSADVIQFLEQFGIQLQELDNGILKISSLIYDQAKKYDTLIGYFSSLIIIGVLQVLTDVQSDEQNEDTEYLVISNYFSKLWNRFLKNKTIRNQQISVQFIFQKVITNIIGLITNFIAMIITEFTTNELQSAKSIQKLITKVLVYLIFTIQIADGRYILFLLQISAYFIINGMCKNMKNNPGMAKVVKQMQFFYLMAYLELCLTGFIKQVIFPFEFIVNIFGIHQKVLKQDIKFVLNRKQWVESLNQLLILSVMLVFLCVSPDNILQIVLLCLVAVLILWVIILTARGKNYSAGFTSLAVIEIGKNHSGVWQNYIISQKAFKYNVIPFVGPIIAFVFQYLNSPPIIIDGQLQKIFPYFLNYVNLISFFVCLILFGQNNQNYIIFMIIWIFCFIFDVWEESADMLAQNDFTFKDLINQIKKKRENKNKTGKEPERQIVAQETVQITESVWAGSDKVDEIEGKDQ